MEYVTAANLPEGEAHNQRDIGMRENHAAGRNALEGNFEQMLEDYRIVSVVSDCLRIKNPHNPYRFGYDAMDDAEEWWINWGRFRERAMSNASGGVNFGQSISNTTSSGSGDEEELEEKY
jgi:salicylate hydroxylase